MRDFLKGIFTVSAIIIFISVEPANPDSMAMNMTPKAKMLVSIERIYEGYVATSYSVVWGASPLPLESGETIYRLIGSRGKLLLKGRIHIPQLIYHDKIDDSGKITGLTTPVKGPLVVTLPYYRSVEVIELRDNKGRTLMREYIKNIKRIEFDVTSSGLSDDLIQPDYSGYLSPSLAPNPKPVILGKFIERKELEASPSAVEVTGSVKITGMPQGGYLYVTVYFYNTKDEYIDSTSYANWESSQFSIYLEPGSYFAQAYCWYYEPKLDLEPVTLYPFPQIVPNINVKATQSPEHLKITYSINNLFIGEVKSQSTAMPATVLIINDRLNKKSIFSRRLCSVVDSDEKGSFAVRLPAKKYTFVVVPWYRDAAAQLLIIKKIKKGVNRGSFECPIPEEVTGKALKRIWPPENGKISTSQSESGKLNILLIAEAFTKDNENFVDQNKNGIWDGDLLLDENGNGLQDKNEYFYDRNRNQTYDPPESFTDKNRDGVCNIYERAKFELTCANVTTEMLNTQPYKKYDDRINVYTYWAASKHGVQKFTKAKPWKKMKTFLGVYCYETGGSQMADVNINRLYEIAASILPDYTIPVVMVNDPFNALRANAMFYFGRILTSAEDLYGGVTLMHELGHSLGNLGDEYVYVEGSTYTGIEPFSVNLTIETDPIKVKWRRYIKGSPPVPTPFDYDGYGIFEGGGAGSFGIYRPTATSMMRELNFSYRKVNETQLKSVLKKFK